MLKKIKKHRLSLLLLAVVGMLSVYYVLLPSEGPVPPVSGVHEGNLRYQEFAEARLEITGERNNQVALVEAKITDATISVNELEMYLLEIDEIISLTEKEVGLESLVNDLGYEDCLVFLDDTVLYITVLAEKFTVEEYITINKIAKEEFGKNIIVSIEFTN